VQEASCVRGMGELRFVGWVRFGGDVVFGEGCTGRSGWIGGPMSGYTMNLANRKKPEKCVALLLYECRGGGCGVSGFGLVVSLGIIPRGGGQNEANRQLRGQRRKRDDNEEEVGGMNVAGEAKKGKSRKKKRNHGRKSAWSQRQEAKKRAGGGGVFLLWGFSSAYLVGEGGVWRGMGERKKGGKGGGSGVGGARRGWLSRHAGPAYGSGCAVAVFVNGGRGATASSGKGVCERWVGG